MSNRREVKVFQVSVQEEDDPIEFDLEFEKTDGAPEVHSFKAHSVIDAGASLAMGSLIKYDERGRQVTDLNAVTRYFEKVLLPGEYPRLSALLERDDLFIPFQLLADVMGWLVEEQSGRPTKRSKPSSAGPRSTGRGSTAKLSSAV